MENSNTFLDNYKLEGQQLQIVKYPSKILKKVAVPVESFGAKLHDLCKNMLYTMYNAPGIGLAAPQVGESIRLFVMDIDYNREEFNNIDGKDEYVLSEFNPQIFINPVISNLEGEILYEEGCLSVPGVYEDVKRANSVTVDYQDMFGNKHSINVDSTFAVCIQHENDHLDGIVFLERLSMLKRNFLQKKYLKNKKKNEEV